MNGAASSRSSAALRLGVTEQDVVDMNRRLGGDVSLNPPIRDDGDSGEWQDWLVDEASDQESRLAESEQLENRKKALGEALAVLAKRERRILEARRLADDPITLEDLAAEFGVSRERVRQIEVRAFEKVQRAVQIAIAGRRPSVREVLSKSLTLRGYINYEFAAEHYAAFLRTVGTAVTDGRIRYREDITDGLENAPAAFIGMLEGRNFGKALVRVTP